jgi:hypothetical protein
MFIIDRTARFIGICPSITIMYSSVVICVEIDTIAVNYLGLTEGLLFYLINIAALDVIIVVICIAIVNVNVIDDTAITVPDHLLHLLHLLLSVSRWATSQLLGL